MKTVTTLKLTQEGAMTILRGALDKARSLSLPASVAVVDDGGHLLAFGRSERRSYTPLRFRRPKPAALRLRVSPRAKRVQAEMSVTIITPSPSLSRQGRVLVTIPGGFPIMVNGRCVGAVGASGAAKNDTAIAEAGIAAFEQS